MVFLGGGAEHCPLLFYDRLLSKQLGHADTITLANCDVLQATLTLAPTTS